jgi:hypothetical protein
LDVGNAPGETIMPALTPEQKTLKEAALAAGDEQWTASEDVVYGPDGDSVCICHGNIGNMPEAIDAEDRATFISLANPTAVLALLAQLETVQEAPSVPAQTGTEPLADAEAQRKSNPDALGQQIAAAMGQRAGQDDDSPHAALIEQLRQLASAYPVEVFPDLTDEQRAMLGGLIDRASAAMGRHLGPFFTQAADALEKSSPVDQPPGEAQ